MSTLTATNGESFHIWALHDDSSREVSPSIEFNYIANDLGNGYEARVLYGSDTGLKTWSITLPTLAGTDMNVPTVTGVDGETVTREQYLWDLYCEYKVTGKPFVFTCPRDGLQYLVRFANSRLTYEKEFRMALYSTGIELTQFRESGVSILMLPSVSSPLSDYGDFWDNSGHSSPNWNSGYIGSGNALVDTLATASFGATTQNGRNIVRLNPSGSATRFDSGVATVNEFFAVMKVREATFSNAGVLFGTSSTGKIKGTSSGTKWQNPVHSGLRYWLNGVEYDVTDMQAPMDEWGVVRVRSATDFISSGNASIGAEGTSNGLKADIAEIVMFSTPLSIQIGRQVAEHLAVKWNISA